jgi:anti-anti-sigma factor
VVKPSYEIVVDALGGGSVLRVRGKFAHEAALAIEASLTEHPAPHVLNLSEVDYISSTGVAALVKLSTKGVQMASPATCVRDVLSLAGIERILTLHPDDQAAFDACQSS